MMPAEVSTSVVGLREGGFSLLEAIVALAILASVGMALFAGINQSVQMVSRAENARQIDAALLNSLAWVETLNPAETPSGKQLLGDLEMRWSSQLLEEPQPYFRIAAEGGNAWVGLYRVNVQLWRDGRLFVETDFKRLGFGRSKDTMVDS